MNIIERIKSPTPPFFRKLRNISLSLATVGAAIAAAPAALPAIILKAAGYLAVAGAVGTAVSQTATGKDDQSTPPKENADQ